MNALAWLFVGIAGIMIFAFIGQLFTAWIKDICYQFKKRKAIKNRTDDRWIYKI